MISGEHFRTLCIYDEQGSFYGEAYAPQEVQIKNICSTYQKVRGKIKK